MDVPTWHPANSDKDAAENKQRSDRTEFQVMPGSSLDATSPEGQLLMNELQESQASHGVFDNVGFFDSSDRLYLKEQRRFRDQHANAIKSEDAKALASFRKASLKQALDDTLPIPVNALLKQDSKDIPTNVLSSIVKVIKPKKASVQKNKNKTEKIKAKEKNRESPLNRNQQKKSLDDEVVVKTTGHLIALGEYDISSSDSD